MTKDDRIQLARECLRQIWQIYDLGGHSMGRSAEATLLEYALELMPSDHSYSSEADNNYDEFIKRVKDEIYRMRMKQRRADNKKAGLRPDA